MEETPSLDASRLSRAGPVAALLAVVVVGAVLRLVELSERGLIYWDEAKFALEGVRLASLLTVAAGGTAPLTAGKAIGTAKPTHALLIGLTMLLVGQNDYSALYLDALASVAGVVLTYLVGSRLFDPLVGVVSALLLAVSEYDVVYARSALSESDASLFFLLGVLCWVYGLRASDGRFPGPLATTASAFFLGFAFTTNYRLIVFGGVLAGFDLTRRLVLHEWRLVPLAGAWWFSGFVLAPGAWQIADWITRGRGLDLFFLEGTHQTAWYLQEAIYQLHQGKQAVVHFEPVTYLQWYVVRQGLGATILVLVGLVVAARARTVSWLLPSTLVVVPYAIYVSAPFIVPRNLTPLLPFAAILAAAGLVHVARSLPRPGGWIAGLGVLLAVAALESAQTWQLTGERSGYAAAARLVLKHGGGRAITDTEVSVFYLRGNGQDCTALRMPVDIAGLQAAIAHGYRYAVLDVPRSSPLESYVRTRSRVVARYSELGDLHVGENLIRSENTWPPSSHDRARFVEVLRLPSSVAANGSQRVPSCNLDVPV